MANESSKLPSMLTTKEMRTNVNRFLKNLVLKANKDYRPRFSFGEAEERKIRVTPLDFATGTSPNGVEPLIRPLAQVDVEKLLNDLSEPLYKDFIDPFYDPDFPGARRQEAWSFYVLINYYLTQRQVKNRRGACIIPDRTKWRAFGHNITQLFRYSRDDIGCDWYVMDVWRYCTEPLLDLHFDGYVDPSKPHTTCFLVDEQELKDGFISTSELTAICWLTCQSALLPDYAHQTIFPLTVVSASHRTVRIVQGVVNICTNDVELRVSQLVPFEKGIKADTESWQNFLTLIGWILGEPIGDTMLA